MKIKHGQKAPWAYGYAWSNLETNTSEAYIIPFNWIIAWLREIWLFIRRGRKDRRKTAAQDWYNKGWEHGYKTGKNHKY